MTDRRNGVQALARLARWWLCFRGQHDWVFAEPADYCLHCGRRPSSWNDKVGAILAGMDTIEARGTGGHQWVEFTCPHCLKLMGYVDFAAPDYPSRENEVFFGTNLGRYRSAAHEPTCPMLGPKGNNGFSPVGRRIADEDWPGYYVPPSGVSA